MQKVLEFCEERVEDTGPSDAPGTGRGDDGRAQEEVPRGG